MRNFFVFSLIISFLFSCANLKKIPKLDSEIKNQFEASNEYSSLLEIYGTEYWDSIKNYDDLQLLPDFIQQNISKTFKISLTEFTGDLVFDKAYENNFDKIINDTSNFRYSLISKTIYPKYIIEYKLIDSTIFKNGYSLTLSFDSFGQLLEMNWPRENFNLKEKISNKETICHLAKKYARKHFFKFKKVSIIELIYNHSMNKFIWKVSFYQGKKLFNSSFRKYKVVIVDPLNLSVLKSYTNYKSIYRTCCGISF